jgi:sec-independent protein translocase protein TatC
MSQDKGADREQRADEADIVSTESTLEDRGEAGENVSEAPLPDSESADETSLAGFDDGQDSPGSGSPEQGAEDSGLADAADGETDAGEESSAQESDESADITVRSETAADTTEGQTKEEATEEEPPHEMTFTEHLNELRVRLMRCLIGAFVGFLACYAFAEQLFTLLMQPLVTLLEPSGGALIYTGLPEAFFTHVKVAALAGLFVASPYIFYQIWMFIAPGLYEGERKYMIPIALCSAICFITGALFGYYVVFPFGFQFFLGYASEVIKPMPSVKEYFSFSTSMLFAFGLIFELPLFMFFLSVLGIVNYKSLRKFRKFAILGSFVVAAILTPPDVVSQCLMAGPMCLLYEIGILVAYVFGKKPKESPEEDEASKAKA